MKNTIRMAIAVVAVAILTPARAANLNSVYIDQVGSGSTISITQNGSGNEAGNSTTAMTMNGGAQQINIDQVGSNNTHAVNVQGGGAVVNSTATGSNNSTTIN